MAINLAITILIVASQSLVFLFVLGNESLLNLFEGGFVTGFQLRVKVFLEEFVGFADKRARWLRIALNEEADVEDKLEILGVSPNNIAILLLSSEFSEVFRFNECH